jgi:bifunctional UDP-N-acetylglucosamine pyrophosphorylase/glucosamine-1-phosphate N-acetyltransferase
METTSAIVLAAGQGTRMKSALPKMMHRVCGLPIVHFAVRAALDAGCREVVVVVGHGRALVEKYLSSAFAGSRVRTAVQEAQRGTGDAARVGLGEIDPRSIRAIVMNGDVPLVRGDDLLAVARPLDDPHAPAELALATCILADPSGYGRVLRSEGRVIEIREHRDLRDDSERAVREINAGIYATPLPLLREALSSLRPDNSQHELYLTDVVAFASRAGHRVATVTLGEEVLSGINDRQQLASVAQTMHDRLVRGWRLAGATVGDGARLDASVILEQDAVIESGAVLRGATRIGRGATVDVGCVLTNVIVGAEAVLRPYTVATDSRVGERAQVGPFAHLRADSELGDEAHVGNFVETKKTKMARGAKANHLAYLGDGVIGERANIGAGTIFCNYDGARKHTTTIEAGAFIGSDSQLVAPVTVGTNAYVATGTTVTRDVPPDALAIARVRQENKENYAPKLRARLGIAPPAEQGADASKGRTRAK